MLDRPTVPDETPGRARSAGTERRDPSHAAERGLARVLDAIAPPSRASIEGVRSHLDALAKPPGSLGRLEAIALRLARIYGDPPGPLRRRTVVLMAADHGVAARGVSAYPPEVTAQMCGLFAAGRAAINAIARAVDADVVAVDVGVDTEPSGLTGVEPRKVRRGTRDLAAGPALTRDETLRAIGVGLDVAAEHAAQTDIFALGDMGIGSTTAAAAVTAALTGEPSSAVVGPGTGVDGERLCRKREVVREAVAALPWDADPIDVLARVGGLEIAALAGVTLGAAAAGRAVVADGFIATAGALAAVRLCPAARDYIFASHRSAVPGHGVQLDALELDPILDLGLRLGEGTGAALALPALEAAAAVLREMATFDDAGVSGPADGGAPEADVRGGSAGAGGGRPGPRARAGGANA